MYIYIYICISMGMCMYMYVCMHVHLDTQVDGLFADYSSCNYIKTSGLRFFLSLLFSVSESSQKMVLLGVQDWNPSLSVQSQVWQLQLPHFAAVTPSNLQKLKPGGAPISLLFLILFQQYAAAKPQSWPRLNQLQNCWVSRIRVSTKNNISRDPFH